MNNNHLHNANPFDFVPFCGDPLLKSLSQWEADYGQLLTGYIDFELHVLQPVHIVGTVTGNINQSIRSHFYRQNNQATIPSSSLRGMLRGFVEAASAGWVGKATEDYDKKFRGRHIAFAATKAKTTEHGRFDNRIFKRTLPQGIPEKFCFPEGAITSDEFDLASYLFGFVGKKEAKKGVVAFEDVMIHNDALSEAELVDLKGAPFMGGAKPSASNWWYFHPMQKAIRRPGGNKVFELVGAQYRGRKFYYHQNYQNAVLWYRNHGANRQSLMTVQAESVKRGSSHSCRLYFNRLGENLVRAIVAMLDPGNDIRHKVGYAKAFGLGSVEFKNPQVFARQLGKFGDVQNIGSELDWKLKIKELPDGDLFGDLFDRQSLESLSRILSYDTTHVYTYPQFGREREFGLPIRAGESEGEMIYSDLDTRDDALDLLTCSDDYLRRESEDSGYDFVKLAAEYQKHARSKSEDVYLNRRASAIDIYQEKSNAWKTISKRKL
jgi:CRISPR/Cas system CSM-associated protein Csm3 (group 7 of RAMP superfamily)